MQNLIKTLADTLFVDLVNKDCNGANINKNEFDVMIEAYKAEHKNTNFFPICSPAATLPPPPPGNTCLPFCARMDISHPPGNT